jgi:hypothetical protein
MRLIATLFAAALGHRINTAGPTNVQSDLLKDHDQFLTAQVGSGRMTSWTGETTLSIVKVRRLGGFMRWPYWEMYKGTTKSTNLEGMEQQFTWKSWFNPVAKARNSVRQGNKDGPTVNRVHYNQLRRKNARVRAFITEAGNRGKTYYTMSLLGKYLGGKSRETGETGHHFNKRTNAYNMGVGKCSGNLASTKACKGRLYTAKAFNGAYSVQVFKGDDMVAESTLADSKLSTADRYIIGEKKRFDVKINSGQDNLAVAEFLAFIVDIEEYIMLAR